MKVISVSIRVPDWVDEEEVEKAIREIEDRLWGEIPAKALRERLGIREEDLTYDIGVIDYRSLRNEGYRRLRRMLNLDL